MKQNLVHKIRIGREKCNCPQFHECICLKGMSLLTSLWPFDFGVGRVTLAYPKVMRKQSRKFEDNRMIPQVTTALRTINNMAIKPTKVLLKLFVTWFLIGWKPT